jgi:tRNA(Ile)-lysidine synthase
MDGRGPVEDTELEGLFKTLLGREFALAVSGGADSTALMLLVARWLRAKRREMPARAPLVVTVDHRLRPQAAAEAIAVGRAATALGFTHKTLVWRGAKPKSGLQAAARLARYRLMASALEEVDGPSVSPRALVLAHTLDDQAETFLMRLARGSGVDGLAAMRPLDVLEVWAGKRLTLCRPLLGVPKARLVATLEAAGMAWSEDMSNTIDAFERVRIRKALAELGPLGIEARAIGRSAARIGRAEIALSALAAELSSRAIDWHDGAYARIDLKVISATGAAAGEMLVRVLANAISVMGGQSTAAQLSQIESLAERLAACSAGGEAVKASLGGCLIEAEVNSAQIYREPGRKGLPRLVLEPGETARWDRRFVVAADPRLGHSIAIEPLGAARWAKLKSAHPALKRLQLPARAAATLPAVMHRGQLFVAPLPAEGQSGLTLVRTLANSLVSIVFEPATGDSGKAEV